MKLASLYRVLMAALLSVFLASPSMAHRSNENYVYFDVTDQSLSGRFEVTFADIDAVLDIDTDGNGTVEEAEFMAASDRIFSYLSDRMTLTHNGEELTLSPGDVTTFNAGFIGVFGQLGFQVEGLSTIPDEVGIKFEPLTDINSNHAALILIASNTRVGVEENESYVSLTFTKGDGPKTLSLVGEPWLTVFVDFVIHGIWHIWLGFDHVVFLLTLLLPSVMMAQSRKWVPEEAFRASFWNVAKIVTVFTLSHSVTLTLAGLGVLQMPVPLVEAIIAASIIAVAIMNMFPSVHRHMLWIVFIFGLFHGFGFANVLVPLALDPSRQIVGIAAFNIGVEIGQLAIVLVAFPLLWAIRRWSLYPFMAFRLGTAVLVLVAGIWFLERTTEFEFNVRGTVKSITGIQL